MCVSAERSRQSWCPPRVSEAVWGGVASLGTPNERRDYRLYVSQFCCNHLLSSVYPLKTAGISHRCGMVAHMGMEQLHRLVDHYRRPSSTPLRFWIIDTILALLNEPSSLTGSRSHAICSFPDSKIRFGNDKVEKEEPCRRPPTGPLQMMGYLGTSIFCATITKICVVCYADETAHTDLYT